MSKLPFASDYMEGAHPNIIRALTETNLMGTAGYGTDEITCEARRKVAKACGCPDADVFFLIGGTQTNATVIDGFLQGYEGVIAADTGHIALHEAGAIEFGGHKVLTVPHTLGKIEPDVLRSYLADHAADGNYDHMVIPGMLYISQPTEFGTLYSLKELQKLRSICDDYHLSFYLDGARLAYALSTPSNDVTIRDIARLCDVFYIGGTKCGAMIGEAVVIPQKGRIPHFFTTIKQHGALLAKGRILGIQFDTLFTDDLYFHLGDYAIKAADEIRAAIDKKGRRQQFVAPTNQIFLIIDNEELKTFGEKVAYSFWEKYDETHTVLRLATSWATTPENVQKLIDLL
ncbi:MAG: low specificity L-threonine aldolase [Lachnospiraceae bacterium]|nr:low specificity L-threonine aldolase [Lachnospiraceae bacterium]